MAQKMAKGLIQVYTVDGKGKTTAALGLAMRAAGRGLRVCFIQFLKGEPSGEHLFVELYKPFEMVQPSSGSSFEKSKEQLGREAGQTLSDAGERMLSGKYDMLVLDEVLVAVQKGLITIAQVLDLLEKKPDSVELVLTGRGAPSEIISRADLVTEMRMIKHPLKEGIPARRGIEY